MRLYDGLERQPRVQDGVHEPRGRMLVEPEMRGHVRAAQIRVDDEHARVDGLGERARQVDGRRRLAVGGVRARDRDDREIGRPVELFDHVAERPILLGFERRRGEEAHQVLFDLGGALLDRRSDFPRRLEDRLGRPRRDVRRRCRRRCRRRNGSRRWGRGRGGHGGDDRLIRGRRRGGPVAEGPFLLGSLEGLEEGAHGTTSWRTD